MFTRRPSAYSRPFLYVVGWTSSRSCRNQGASIAGGAALGGAGRAPPLTGGGGRLGGSGASGVDTSFKRTASPTRHRRTGGSVLLPRQGRPTFPAPAQPASKRRVVKGGAAMACGRESPRSPRRSGGTGTGPGPPLRGRFDRRSP